MDKSYPRKDGSPMSSSHAETTTHHPLYSAEYSSRLLNPPDKRRQQQQQQRRAYQQKQRFQQEDKNNNSIPDDYIEGTDPSLEGQLRATLLQNYERNSYPWEVMWERQQQFGLNRTGIDVEFNLNFHKVHALNVAESTAHLVVWVQMRWTDPRLTWDPADHGNITKTWFWIQDGIGGGEASEVWTPDVYLWNQEESLQSSLADTYCSVVPDGTVFWTRPGLIKATCKFRGLGSFPFDTLRCMLEFGSWTRSGLHVRPVLMSGTGYSVGGSETAGQSFAEFELKSVTSSVFTYPPYPGAPNEDWPVLLYNIECQRASRPYVRGYLLLQILLNFCAFACMWIPPLAGERMGLAITSLLSSVASELTVSATLPSSEEVNWFTIFSMFSMVFSVIIVFQSTAVIYFYYFTGSNLTPHLVKWILTKWEARRQKTAAVWSGCLTTNGMASVICKESDMNLTASRSGVTGKINEPRIEKTTPAVTAGRQAILSPGIPATHLDEANVMNASMSSRGILARHDAEDFQDDEERQNNVKWQRLSRQIDDYSRLIIPTLYVIFLAIIMAKAGN